MFMKHIISLLVVLFLGSSLFAQGEKGNATNSNSAPEQIEINTRNSINSISNVEIMNQMDSVQNSVFEDNELKEVQSVSGKSSVSKKSVNKSKKELTSKIDQKNTLVQLNQIQVASRNQSTQRSPTIQQQLQMDQLVKQLENQDSTAFEYHINKFIASNYNVELKQQLQFANKLDSNDTRVIKQLAAVAFIELDTLTLLNNLETQVDRGILNQEVLSYCADMLSSAPPQGTLITHSFDDTYAALYNQLKFNNNRGVTILNLDFFQSSLYRKKVSEMEYVVPDSKLVNTQFLVDFCKLNTSKSLALSLTIPADYLKAIQTDLYVQGLVFDFDPKNELIDRNSSLFEEKLTFKVVSEESSLSANYIPMLLELKSLYRQRNAPNQEKKVDFLIDEIARKSPQKKLIQELKKN
jgi:hypothetical protein